ncbi:MAG: adenylate/guanylate cyclase domain-containing protein [Polyangiaceae bacterium]
MPDGPVSVAERQVTVLFCDLVGSTQLSERLDRGSTRSCRRIQAAASEVVERYEGHVAQYLGDGLLVYFGYPRAQEDAARRAVLSALAIIDGIQVATRRPSASAASRSPCASASTGSGVVGDVGGKTKREQLVIGNTPNVAARLQGLAEPDTVVISAVTPAHGRLFRVRVPRPAIAEGRVHAARSPARDGRAPRGRSAARVEGAKATPFVGRTWISPCCARASRRPARGTARRSSSPGRSRHRKEPPRHRVPRGGGRADPVDDLPLLAVCHEYGLFPARRADRAALRDRPDARPEGPDRAPRRLDRGRGRSRQAPALLAALLAVPWSADRPRLSLTPQQERDATLKLLTRILLDRAAAGRVVLVFEDLHWIDPSTLAFVQGLLTAITTERVLLLLATRPSFSPPWQPAPNIARIDLGKLADADAEQIVLRLSGGESPSPTSSCARSSTSATASPSSSRS